jgi:hypothetical protein
MVLALYVNARDPRPDDAGPEFDPPPEETGYAPQILDGDAWIVSEAMALYPEVLFRLNAPVIIRGYCVSDRMGRCQWAERFTDPVRIDRMGDLWLGLSLGLADKT